MKFLNFNQVLCLSPHPDDAEYSIMGTIMKYSDTIFTILCLTSGGTRCLKTVCSNSGDKVNRHLEVLNSWQVAQTQNTRILFSDCSFIEDKDRDAGWVNYLENEYIKKNDFDCLLLPNGEDSMFEHRFVNKLGPALCRHSAISMIEYQTPSTLNSWTPNMFVDIGDFYDKKKKALDCFTSQKNKSYFSDPALEAFHSNFQCAKKGMSKTEHFKIIEFFQKGL